jgi:hypothetical protein
LRQVAQVVAVERDAAGFGVPEAGREREQRALARARRPTIAAVLPAGTRSETLSRTSGAPGL